MPPPPRGRDREHQLGSSSRPESGELSCAGHDVHRRATAPPPGVRQVVREMDSTPLDPPRAEHD